MMIDNNLLMRIKDVEIITCQTNFVLGQRFEIALPNLTKSRIESRDTTHRNKARVATDCQRPSYL
jgi:hypothetical protein